MGKQVRNFISWFNIWSFLEITNYTSVHRTVDSHEQRKKQHKGNLSLLTLPCACLILLFFITLPYKLQHLNNYFLLIWHKADSEREKAFRLVGHVQLIAKYLHKICNSNLTKDKTIIAVSISGKHRCKSIRCKSKMQKKNYCLDIFKIGNAILHTVTENSWHQSPRLPCI